MITLIGLQTLAPPEDRTLASIQIDVNGETYDWQVYIPGSVTNLGEYLSSIEQKTINDILAKEADWDALDPKTKEIQDGESGNLITVPIDKSEIVRPSIPDYYAKRRSEYPSIGDQLDAIWKGSGSEDFTSILQQIEYIKNKYPKQ